MFASFLDAEIWIGAFSTYPSSIHNIPHSAFNKAIVSCVPGDYGQNMLMGKPFPCFSYGSEGRVQTGLGEEGHVAVWLTKTLHAPNDSSITLPNLAAVLES